MQTAIVEGLAKQIMDKDLPSLMGVKASVPLRSWLRFLEFS